LFIYVHKVQDAARGAGNGLQIGIQGVMGIGRSP
jgi:hypothetical protein